MLLEDRNAVIYGAGGKVGGAFDHDRAEKP